jgi:hypothetical protein
MSKKALRIPIIFKITWHWSYDRGHSTCPPLLSQRSRSDDDVVAVQELSHLEGAAAAGVKPLLKFRFLLNSSPEPKKRSSH